MDIIFNDFNKYKGYEMLCTYHINIETLKPYAKMMIYYKGNKIYIKDLYDDDRFITEELYKKQCILHIRNNKLEQLGIK